MLLGYSRGSVGDVTFYRSGGSQRQRARNRNPQNPRTEAQMSQRSKFANAVKFFKQANSGFFKFAFEDKKTNESDYNAFMRHNLVNSGYIGAQASKIANWPALGTWQLSSGSLPEITAPFPQPTNVLNEFYFDLGVDFRNYDIDSSQTIGLLSSFLINNSGGVWREGDILTVPIYLIDNKFNLPTVDTSLNIGASFGYLQLVLNSSNSEPLSSLSSTISGLSVSISLTNDQYVGFHLFSSLEQGTSIYFAACVIHSRNTSNGLLVSDSILISKTDNELNTLAMQDSGTYYNSVIADWDATQNAILQGVYISGITLPTSLHLTLSNGSNLVINRNQTVNVNPTLYDGATYELYAGNVKLPLFDSDDHSIYDISFSVSGNLTEPFYNPNGNTNTFTLHFTPALDANSNGILTININGLYFNVNF